MNYYVKPVDDATQRAHGVLDAHGAATPSSHQRPAIEASRPICFASTCRWHYKAPSHPRVPEDLPRNAVGKIAKRDLVEHT
jgi:acyl-CoA synthetase (AMP-forming)/AMP-acid ligase II